LRFRLSGELLTILFPPFFSQLFLRRRSVVFCEVSGLSLFTSGLEDRVLTSRRFSPLLSPGGFFFVSPPRFSPFLFFFDGGRSFSFLACVQGWRPVCSKGWVTTPFGDASLPQCCAFFFRDLLIPAFRRAVFFFFSDTSTALLFPFSQFLARSNFSLVLRPTPVPP